MKIVYNHPSVPKLGIKIGVVYELDFVKTLFKDYKTFFKPIDGEWESQKKSKKKIDIADIEELEKDVDIKVE